MKASKGEIPLLPQIHYELAANASEARREICKSMVTKLAMFVQLSVGIRHSVKKETV
ncbi:hypothetical protein KIN20_006819 [Parelaphostrongylus tenuis]|uniref:Uncharacterized protein n=1 Tax=Parelaphostrongylus tenuis TaxID=148309 RepID=A0AAD5QIM7_PARTN|nr:hypothetical protein KIN20_006819 [Parelaphostrongylus tenuis]